MSFLYPPILKIEVISIPKNWKCFSCKKTWFLLTKSGLTICPGCTEWACFGLDRYIPKGAWNDKKDLDWFQKGLPYKGKSQKGQSHKK